MATQVTMWNSNRGVTFLTKEEALEDDLITDLRNVFHPKDDSWGSIDLINLSKNRVKVLEVLLKHQVIFDNYK